MLCTVNTQISIIDFSLVEVFVRACELNISVDSYIDHNESSSYKRQKVCYTYDNDDRETTELMIALVLREGSFENALQTYIQLCLSYGDLSQL